MKKSIFVTFLVVGAVIGLAALIVRHSQSWNPSFPDIAAVLESSDGALVNAQLGPYGLKLELSINEQQRARGLSNREAPQGNGMLFIFPVRSVQEFWNSDMKFPLILYWVDGDTIIGASSLPTDDRQQRVTVRSPQAVTAVIEVPEQWSRAHAVSFPTTVRLSPTRKNGQEWRTLVR